MRYLAVIFMLMGGSAEGATLYKCVDKDGHPTYQQTPCPEGQEQSSREVRISAGPAPATASTGRQVKAAPAPAATDGYSTSPRPQVDQRPQRQGPAAYRCVKPNGTVYFSPAGCGTSVVAGDPQPREWRRDTVQGMPAAVMVAPDRALDPITNTFHQLTPAPTVVRPTYRVADQAELVSRRAACEGQRAAAAERRDREWRSLSVKQRRQLDEQVRALCE